MDLHENQAKAIELATAKNGPRLVCIQGGAGTGKTTIIREIRSRLDSVTLCAPTGKAAARMREACGTSAETIHRMLMYDGTGFRCETLAGLTIICDEATMVDSSLLAEVLKRTPRRVILVGDFAQLPPVGAGQPFHDVVSRRSDIVAELTHCYRATEAVYEAATAIRHGRPPKREHASREERWHVQDTGTVQATHDAILDLVRRNELEFAKGADIILAPRNGRRNETDPGTVFWLNHDIARILIPRADDEFLCVGDRVINTENNSELDIWNGTTGVVADLEPRGAVWIETDQPVRGGAGGQTTSVRLTKGQARKLDLAYALSVHKSQGSQYDRVVFACHQKDAFSLSRSLIYTAVTRTRRECLVMGGYGALCAGINRQGAKRTVLGYLMDRETQNQTTTGDTPW
jgi:exodeoxyribonuclease V alpha subunit